MKALNVVVVGSGMYVTGRGTEAFGTIMPALLEWRRSRQLGDIFIAGTRPKNIGQTKLRIRELARFMGVKTPEIRYYPRLDSTGRSSCRTAFSDISKPACAIVCVPDHLHTTVALQAIKSGLHTFVVKPLAPTVKEAVNLRDTLKKANLYGAVDFHKRWDEANIKMKDLVSAGAIGDPLYILVEYSQRKSVPETLFRQWINNTNIFQYLGVHYVDIIYFATGGAPKRVMATGQKRWLRSKGLDAYDSIQAVIEWETPSGSRFVSHVLTNWIDPESTSAMSDQKIKIIGTKGRFESDQKQRGVRIVLDGRTQEEPNPYFSAAYGGKGKARYRGYGIKSVHQFLDDCCDIGSGSMRPEDLEHERPTFGQSLISTAVIEAVNRSLANKSSWVKV